MNELALFAGIGGGILGGLLCGFRTVCAVEINPFCREVLLGRQMDGCLPKFPIWDDIKTFDGKPWRGKIDIVTGGFPCQDISCAGIGKGINGAQSGLWFEMARIIEEVQPQWVSIENSPNLRTRGLATVLEDLASMGYFARWGVLGARNVGAHHRRNRMWIVAHSASVGLQRSLRKIQNGPAQSTVQDMVKAYDRRAVFCLPEPIGIRKTNGISCYMDKIKSLGNAQVPQVAQIAWEILSATLAGRG